MNGSGAIRVCESALSDLEKKHVIRLAKGYADGRR